MFDWRAVCSSNVYFLSDEKFVALKIIKQKKTQLPTKILGSTAEMKITNKTVARQDRRGRVGYIDDTIISRFGNICSPFQALSIKVDTKSVLLIFM